MLGSFKNCGCLWVTDMKPGGGETLMSDRNKHLSALIPLMSYNQLMSQNINVLFCTRNMVHLVWLKKRLFKRGKRTHRVSFLYRFGDFLLFSSTQACRRKSRHESFYPHNTAHTQQFRASAHLWCVGHKFCLCAVRWTVRAAVKKPDDRKQSVTFRLCWSSVWVMQPERKRLTVSLISCQLLNTYFYLLFFSLSHFEENSQTSLMSTC